MVTTRTELTLQMTKLLANMMTDDKRDQITLCCKSTTTHWMRLLNKAKSIQLHSRLVSTGCFSIFAQWLNRIYHSTCISNHPSLRDRNLFLIINCRHLSPRWTRLWSLPPLQFPAPHSGVQWPASNELNCWCINQNHCIRSGSSSFIDYML